MMFFVKFDEHRIVTEEIIRYSPAVGTDPKFKTEIELSTGKSIFVTLTPEELDEAVNGYGPFGAAFR